MTALNRNQPKLANHLYILTTWTTPTTCVDARSTSTSGTTHRKCNLITIPIHSKMQYPLQIIM